MDVIHKINTKQVVFRCPGCKDNHVLRVNAEEQPFWGWNRDLVKPTFTPSILSTSNYGENNQKQVCHSFVTDGKIQFLNDCTHDKAGQTLDIPAWDLGKWE